MVTVADVMPGLKRCLSRTALSESSRALVMRMVTAFLLHSGRMSGLQAAGSVRSEARHRAQISRFLARPRWRDCDINSLLRQMLLEREASDGLFVFIVDATLCSQSGKRTENTGSTGNRKRRPRKGRRYGQNKHVRKNCHSFTAGLLLTPSGLRIPFCKPYHTHEYCQRNGLVHRTTAEAAAELIRELPLPEEAEVVVLGDTAYEAQVVRDACAARGYSWIFPGNPERVLAGPKGHRPKVRSLLKDWATWSRQTIRLARTPSTGDCRRIGSGRIRNRGRTSSIRCLWSRTFGHIRPLSELRHRWSQFRECRAKIGTADVLTPDSASHVWSAPCGTYRGTADPCARQESAAITGAPLSVLAPKSGQALQLSASYASVATVRT